MRYSNPTSVCLVATALALAGCVDEGEGEGDGCVHGAGGGEACEAQCIFTEPNGGDDEAVCVEKYRCDYAKFDSSSTDDPIPGDKDDNPDASKNTGPRTVFSIDWSAADGSRIGSNKSYYESSAHYRYGCLP